MFLVHVSLSDPVLTLPCRDKVCLRSVSTFNIKLIGFYNKSGSSTQAYGIPALPEHLKIIQLLCRKPKEAVPISRLGPQDLDVVEA